VSSQNEINRHASIIAGIIGDHKSRKTLTRCGIADEEDEAADDGDCDSSDERSQLQTDVIVNDF
jgi:hypothetical protein